MNNFEYTHPKLEEALGNEEITDQYHDDIIEQMCKEVDVFAFTKFIIENDRHSVCEIQKHIRDIKAAYKRDLEIKVNEMLCDAETETAIEKKEAKEYFCG